jgi:hypothetical protein
MEWIGTVDDLLLVPDKTISIARGFQFSYYVINLTKVQPLTIILNILSSYPSET